MSRGHERLLGRSSSPPFHNMEWIMAWLWEDFGRPSHTKKGQTFMCVKICIFMYLYIIIAFNMLKYRYDNIITETNL